tara:strand:+ start:1089 stop:1295 length:207 start_codon:yes stop_codon:yes gene_type:complete
METKETYYLVEYECIYGGRQLEGVFTEKAWKHYIKEENSYRNAEDERLYDEDMEDNMEFIFTEIEVYN